MASQQEMQEKLVLYQLLQQHLETLKQQAVLLQNRFMELEVTKQAVDDIKKIKQVNDTLIPLGSGVYVHGKINDIKKVLVDVGAGVMMNKDIDASLAVIEDKRAEVEKLLESLQGEVNEVVQKINQIGAQLQAMMQQEKGKE